jgi:hypothetical protein
MSMLKHTPHPHPLPTGGRGAANPATFTTLQTRRLPPPHVGEGWGGGATRPQQSSVQGAAA